VVISDNTRPVPYRGKSGILWLILILLKMFIIRRGCIPLWVIGHPEEYERPLAKNSSRECMALRL